MKSLLARTLTSTLLVLGSFAAAHAANHSPFPSAAMEFSSAPLPPALIRYFEQRDAIIAKEQMDEAKRQTRPPLRPRFLPHQPPLISPAQIEWGYQREAAVAKELRDEQMDRQRSGRPAPESAMEWMQRQPQRID